MAMTPAQKQRAYRERLRQKNLGELPASPGPCNIAPVKRWEGMKDQARTLLQQLHDETEAYFDDRSEQWQESDKGEAMRERIEALAAILDDLDTLP